LAESAVYGQISIWLGPQLPIWTEAIHKLAHLKPLKVVQLSALQLGPHELPLPCWQEKHLVTLVERLLEYQAQTLSGFDFQSPVNE
jgi:hypothetical protein